MKTNDIALPSSLSDSSGTARTVAWLVVGDERPYGIQRTVELLSGAVRSKGWNTPYIFLYDGPFAQRCRERGLDIRNLNVGIPPSFVGRLWQKPIALLKMLAYQKRAQKKIVAALKELDADVVHIVLPHLLLLAGPAAKQCAIPCFWEMPNAITDAYPFGLNRRLYQWVCARNGIQPLANSRATASGLGDHPVRPIVVHLSADPRIFDPETVNAVSRQELGISDDAVVLGIVSRITQDKGQHLVLRAMLSLGGVDGPLHLVLIGGPTDDEYADSLRQIAREGNASDRLHFVGLVDEPQGYYDAIDIAINSRISNEPFGLSVVEAMMMGRPVLVHALGGPAETVVDGSTGWHVRDPSVASFTEGIRRALFDRPRWPEMRQEARRHALDKFSCQVQAKRYMQIVEQTLCS